MKFDIEKALKGAKVQTMDGRAVTDLAYLPSSDSRLKLVGVMGGSTLFWDVDGCFYQDKSLSMYDLEMASEKHTCYLVIGGNGLVETYFHDKASAERSVMFRGGLKVVEVTYET